MQQKSTAIKAFVQDEPKHLLAWDVKVAVEEPWKLKFPFYNLESSKVTALILGFSLEKDSVYGLLQIMSHSSRAYCF